MIEPLDMAEVAAACVATGLYAVASSRGLLVGIPGRRKRCRWRGNGEHGWLMVILRDEVWKVAPKSYCRPVEAWRPTTPPLVVLLRDGKDDSLYPEVDSTHKADTETECWARALVALYRAGLLPEGR